MHETGVAEETQGNRNGPGVLSRERNKTSNQRGTAARWDFGEGKEAVVTMERNIG